MSPRNHAPHQVSVSGKTYARVSAAAVAAGVTRRELVERALRPVTGVPPRGLRPPRCSRCRKAGHQARFCKEPT